ncbi:MAG TPA: glycosyltransferase family 39 protein [Puia sp.]|nr:glycosyltransferase family 39 protein [Puia sp.]
MQQKRTIILACFIIAKFLLQYLLNNPVYDLHRDEYLYLDQANHLAWGYVSVPPLTSWVAYIISFLGNTMFWVRFFPALFGAFTIIIVWKAIEELKGSLFALILGATCILFSCLLQVNLLFQQNSFDVLCWTAFCFVLIKYINTEKAKWLFIGAVVFAIGFLNKYNFMFLLIGLVPAVLLFPQRKLFANKEFVYSIVLALLLILPNVLWQYHNSFPVVHHMKQLSKTQLVNVNRWSFLKEQVFDFVGSFLIILSAIYALLFYAPFKKYKLFVLSIIFTLSVFTYLRAKGYYAIGLYPIYISFGSVFVGDILKDGWRKYLQPVAIAIPVLFFILLFNIVFSNKSPDYIIKNAQTYKELGLLRWEDGKNHSLPQDFADMLGWKELGSIVDSVYSKLPQQERTLILCDNYGETGAINYYAKNIKHIAVSFNADYINWIDLSKRYDNLIRVKEQLGHELVTSSPYFDSAFIAGSITNPLAREYGATVFLFKKAKIDFRDRIQKEINEKKNYHY